MNKYVKGVLVFIAVLHTMALFTACAKKPKVQGSWVSITKPPVQIVYTNRYNVVTPEVVRQLVRAASLVPYKDYQFNSITGVSGEFNGHQSSTIGNSSEVNINNGN